MNESELAFYLGDRVLVIDRGRVRFGSIGQITALANSRIKPNDPRDAQYHVEFDDDIVCVFIESELRKVPA
jgi:hypothetical protein